MRKRTISTVSYEISKLGKYLKQLREEQGLSIREVARQSEMSPSHLAKIEAGDTFKSISIKTLVKLSKFYGIPVDAILKEAGFIEDALDELPGFAQYLRAKYQLPPQAIRDLEMAKRIVEEKYKKT
ncbi:helix-turn-helix transcriptional regulator [Patescibacteria group bacterium]|nr:helix-turn-helix transcriptional regulator [Patescibacteria group bacterium]MBU4512835.1 helix-turn-helix transcriptional regulator [Patescibacteria group bacterium]MCG2688180.1 helix-turn-helix transcriptional regulator [Candidatus Parcubacteria bacterium]